MIKLIGEQIKALRKFFGLNQTEFGAKIGLKGSSVSNYEVDRVSVTDAVILSICREYGCDDTWLRTGEGEMFRKLSRQEQIADFVGKALADDSGDFRSQLISILASLDDVGWYKLEEAAKAIKEAEEKIKCI